MRLLSIGDNVCDVYLHLAAMYPGGQALNVGVYAKMLGQTSGYIGIFGQDEVSEHIRSVLNELGVDHSHSRVYEGANGFAMVTLVDGERTFLGSNRGGIASVTPLTLNCDDLDYISTFSVIHTSNNSHIDQVLEQLKETGLPISYDFSIQWLEDTEWMKQICSYCTFAFLSLPDDASEDDIQRYIRSFHEAGCPNVIATFGKKGSFFSDGKQLYVQKPHLVEAIDTLGAGDSFAAAFLVNYYNFLEADPDAMIPGSDYYQRAIHDCLDAAAEFSSATCLVRGAFGHGKTIDPDTYTARMKEPGFVR